MRLKVRIQPVCGIPETVNAVYDRHTCYTWLPFARTSLEGKIWQRKLMFAATLFHSILSWRQEYGIFLHPDEDLKSSNFTLQLFSDIITRLRSEDDFSELLHFIVRKCALQTSMSQKFAVFLNYMQESHWAALNDATTHTKKGAMDFISSLYSAPSTGANLCIDENDFNQRVRQRWAKACAIVDQRRVVDDFIISRGTIMVLLHNAREDTAAALRVYSKFRRAKQKGTAKFDIQGGGNNL